MDDPILASLSSKHSIITENSWNEIANSVGALVRARWRYGANFNDTEFSDVPTVTNVRQDLTEWQEKHAHLVLSNVEEISKLRYKLCPRVMTERKFWRIYFILVNNQVAPYEKRYLDNVNLKSTEQFPDDRVKESAKVEITSKAEDKEDKNHSKTSTSSTTEQDLDAFLLGDSDDDPDDGDGNIDDDFDKLVDGLSESRKICILSLSGYN
ncbi:hypothetical protein ACLB2K_052031 [Fragaria x ananassa]